MSDSTTSQKTFESIRMEMDRELRSILEGTSPTIMRDIEDNTNSGRVIEFADGVARLTGLTNAHIGEPVTFRESSVRARQHDASEPEIYGMVVDLDDDEVGCLVFGEERFVREGDVVVRGIRHLVSVQAAPVLDGTWKDAGDDQHLFSVPVGPHLLGKVVDPFCRSLEEGTHSLSMEGGKIPPVHLPIDRRTFGVLHRHPIDKPLLTGLTAVDATLPIGRGQRMLVIGDRNTGKTSIGLDTVIKLNRENQELNKHQSDFENHNPDTVYCVYVAIGRKASEIKRLQKTLIDKDAMEYTTIVAAAANDPAPLVYIAPFAGTAVAEFYRDIGRHALIIYDDLSRHAASYRHISLILRRSPGREAYPGDIFYLHARLLERACNVSGSLNENDKTNEATTETGRQLNALRALASPGSHEGHVSEDLHELYQPYIQNKDHHSWIRGGGSLTALPVIETKQSDYAAYIPTNVISITDGQIYLEPDLFNEGLRPAINHGISVSRVGGKAQAPMMRLVSDRLRINLASYRNQMRYAKFGVETADTEFLRSWGRTIEMLLTQSTGEPRDLSWETAAIFLAVNGFLSACDNTDEIKAFVDAFVAKCKPDLDAANDKKNAKEPSKIDTWTDMFATTGFSMFKEELRKKWQSVLQAQPAEGSKWFKLHEGSKTTSVEKLLNDWEEILNDEINAAKGKASGKKTTADAQKPKKESWYSQLDDRFLKRWQQDRAKYF